MTKEEIKKILTGFHEWIKDGDEPMYLEEIESIDEYAEKLAFDGVLVGVSESNYKPTTSNDSFDINNCINDIEKVIEHEFGVWYKSRSVRYAIKIAIDKMLYSR